MTLGMSCPELRQWLKKLLSYACYTQTMIILHPCLNTVQDSLRAMGESGGISDKKTVMLKFEDCCCRACNSISSLTFENFIKIR